ncbi:MAG: EscU/YscU/HrcU family type III secretion system export apparatus switch protein [Anaerolineae bacterium]|nr:EscU/YscU/HrcU family type III secretion system export apparatus switch protein [Anaerolineae bacterium]
MAERTEQPTARHLAQMREKGDVAQSPEITGAITLLIAVYLLGGRLPALMQSMEDVMRRAFSGLSRTDLTVATVQTGGASLAWVLLRDWLPFFAALAATAVVIGLVQTRGLVSAQKLRPDFGKLNPVSGLKRLFSSQGLFEVGKGVLKMALLGVVLYITVKDTPAQLAALTTHTTVGPGLVFLGDVLAKLARQGAMLLLLAAGLDYVFQFRQHHQRMLMTREELMEEMKSAEGQPLLRAKIRQMQRRMSRQRMMQQLAHADVVVTNPTHLAIALQYDNKKMAAPKVVAKGKGLIAEQIVRRARELRIPIVQNIPLARALIHVELDDVIPVNLYQVVAEVLAFVYRLRRTGGVS